MKWFGVWVVTLTLVIGGVLFTKADALAIAHPSIVKEYYESNTWQIHNKVTSGTAWHLSPTLLITNKHVVDVDARSGKGNPWVLRREGWLNDVPVTVLAMHPTMDLALLECLTCPNFGEIQDSVIWEGDVPLGVVAWGGGWGLGTFSLHVGTTQSAHETWLLYDTPTSSGDSGSPLIGLHNGYLVILGVRTGVLVDQGRHVHHKGLAVKGIDLLNWLEVLEADADGDI